MKENDFLKEFAGQLAPLAKQPEVNFHIALSGGLDSVVLLHLFTRLRETAPNLILFAHHINHGLSKNAQHWRDFCSQLCAQLGVDFTCSTLQLTKPTRTSLEALARDKRYGCLSEKLSSQSYLVTAHHQDDQLETVLLALKRGSGNTGLQGIRYKQKLSSGYLLRPLLNYSRAQLEGYAAQFQLNWIEDESNSDQAFDRNFIRHTISPLLKARWPGIAKSVARSAAICQEQQQILDEIAQQDFATLVFYFLNQQALDFEKLKKLSSGRRNNVLRFWFKENGLDYPSAAQLQAVWSDLVLAKIDALPVIQFKGYSVRRYRTHIYLLKDTDIAANCSESVIWQGEPILNLADGRIALAFSELEFKDNLSGALLVQENSTIEICFRRQLAAQLSCKPIGRTGSRSIKKLLHEYHVPPWLRDFVPFILINGELRMAVGLWQCQTSLSEEYAYNLSVSFA
ncbi:MAG: tRNA(Ile)-lysidine synthase [Psychromonas sp.]|jgi:tRNA(Ile)-lysidine synthase|uniref:tRNA lysidine(34) synthetase TilS n=1 Tax=Psychromonas sp. TaxID=1884585 RepID=UPI0039E5819E